MSANRMDRINSEIKKWLSVIIRDMGDSVICSQVFNVSYVNTSPDLKSSRIGISFFDSDDKDKKEVIKKLHSSKGYIKRELAQYINLKSMPDLSFELDLTEEKAMRIENLLKKISTNNE